MRKLLLILFLVSYVSNAQTIDYKPFDEFLKKHVSDKGVVDYDKVLKNMDQINLITSNFSKISPNKSWTENEIKTFWINVYNINVIKLLAENYPLKSITYIREPFQMNFISFDGEKISLDHIVNEILKPLKDPRVHFVLYNTAVSSPTLRNSAYSSEKLNDDLNVATNLYINDITKNNITAKRCSLSKIFEWNITDFKNKNNIISFINDYSRVTIDEDAKISFMEYNWSLNK